MTAGERMLSQVQSQCITAGAIMEYAISWKTKLRMCQESADLTGFESSNVKQTEVKEKPVQNNFFGQIGRFLIQNVVSKRWLH
jgi:hypothetical protein